MVKSRFLAFSSIILAFIFSSVPSYSSDKECYVQLGAFSKRENAERLFKSLNEHAYLLKINEKGVDFYVVRVGPYSKELCYKAVEELGKRYKLRPIAVWRSRKAIETYLLSEKNGKFVSGAEEKLEKKTVHYQRKVSKRIPKKSKFTGKAKNQDDFYVLLEKARVCFGRRDCQNAIKYLTKAIEKKPNNPQLYVYLGYAYAHLNMFDKALEAFKRALVINNDYPEAYAGIGYLYLKLHSPEVAVLALKQAYELNPREPSYAVNYAIALMEAGKEDEALRVLNSVLKIYPFMPELYYNRALVYLKQGKLKDAVSDLERFLALTKGLSAYASYRKRVNRLLDQIRRG